MAAGLSDKVYPSTNNTDCDNQEPRLRLHDVLYCILYSMKCSHLNMAPSRAGAALLDMDTAFGRRLEKIGFSALWGYTQ